MLANKILNVLILQKQENDQALVGGKEGACCGVVPSH